MSDVRIKVYFEDEECADKQLEVRKLVLPEEPSFTGLESHLLTLLADSQRLYSPSQVIFGAHTFSRYCFEPH